MNKRCSDSIGQKDENLYSGNRTLTEQLVAFQCAAPRVRLVLATHIETNKQTNKQRVYS